LTVLFQGVEGLMANAYATIAGDLDLADTGQIATPTAGVAGTTNVTHIGLGAVTHPGGVAPNRRVPGVVVGPHTTTGTGALRGPKAVTILPVRGAGHFFYGIVF
jgi:hypothetical protein